MYITSFDVDACLILYFEKVFVRWFIPFIVFSSMFYIIYLLSFYVNIFFKMLMYNFNLFTSFPCTYQTFPICHISGALYRTKFNVWNIFQNNDLMKGLFCAFNWVIKCLCIVQQNIVSCIHYFCLLSCTNDIRFYHITFWSFDLINYM